MTKHFNGLRLRPATEEEKSSSKKKLAVLRANDEKKREKADARNSLEAYLYEVKNKMLEHEEVGRDGGREEGRVRRGIVWRQTCMKSRTT